MSSQKKGTSALVGGCPMAWVTSDVGTAFVLESNSTIFMIEAGHDPVAATVDQMQHFMRNRIPGQQLEEVPLPKDPHPYTNLQATLLEDYVRDTLLVLVKHATKKAREMPMRLEAVRHLESRIGSDRTLEALARAMVACDESPEEEAEHDIIGLPQDGRFGELVRRASEIGAMAQTA